MWIIGWGHSIRLELPLRVLAERGVDTIYSDELPADAETADVVVKHFGLAASPEWQRLCESDTRAVFDIDDDVWNVDPSNHACYRSLTDPEWVRALERDIAASHVVTVSTPRLAEVVSRFNSNVVIVPNRVPAWLLEHQRIVREALTIGWQGTWSHGMDWHAVAPHIHHFLVDHPQVDIHVMGSLFPSMTSWPRAYFTPWCEQINDYWQLVDFDIGLAPLVQHVWNESKSSLKALEYGALSIPVVASAVGPYPEYVRHGETGFLVRNDDEWGDYLRLLVNDADLRAEMGRNGREQAAEHTVEGNLDSWLGAWQVSQPTTR